MKTMKISGFTFAFIWTLIAIKYGSAEANSNSTHPILAEAQNSSAVTSNSTRDEDLYSFDDFESEFEEFENITDTRRQMSPDNTTVGHNRVGLSMHRAVLRAAQHGLDVMRELYEYQEPQWYKEGVWLDTDEPGHLLSRFNAPSRGATLQARIGYASLAAAKRLQSISPAQGRTPSKASLRRTPLEGLCPDRQRARCPPASRRYRTHDGTCNAGKDARAGSAVTPSSRLLPPDYNDGIDTPRRSVLGGRALPSPRLISLQVHGARPAAGRVTMMLAHWGQFVDHDMTSTAQQRGFNDSVIRCCTDDGQPLHPACMPIAVPFDDPWLGPFGVTCMEFTRSSPAARHDCTLGWREQINQVTSYLDASGVYGSSARTSDSIRTFRRGQLLEGSGEAVCRRGALASHCFRPGDSRVSEQPGLMAVHMIMSREHNRLADQLADLNPHWSDEKIYQETRRIVGAMIQHITYREFLPLVLGPEVMRLFDLELLDHGYYKGYSTKVDPGVANAFSTAAFRFGHSLVQDSFMRCDSEFRFLVNNVSLHEEQSGFGDRGTPHSLHRLLRGQVTQRSQRRDEFISEELTQRLFQTPRFPFGLDLAAINIARGRDHGLAGYTRWRDPCGLAAVRDWRDLVLVMGSATVQRLRSVYSNVQDIDLFPGGLSERPVLGGLVGPTFACIIAQQFSNTRKGDKFWYENGLFESSFTPAQLQSIRLTTLSQLICNTLRSGTMQLNSMLPVEPSNPQIECGTGPLAPFDLRPWTERAVFADNPQSTPNNPFDPHFPPLGSHLFKNPPQHQTHNRPTHLDPNFPPVSAQVSRKPTIQSDSGSAASHNTVDRIHDKIGAIRPAQTIKISDKLNIPTRAPTTAFNKKTQTTNKRPPNKNKGKPATNLATFRDGNETTDARNSETAIAAETDTTTFEILADADTKNLTDDDKATGKNNKHTLYDNATIPDTRRSTTPTDKYRPDVRQNGYYDSSDTNLEREYYDITIRVHRPTTSAHEPLKPITVFDSVKPVSSSVKYRPQTHLSDKYRPASTQPNRYRPVTVYDTSDNVPVTILHDKNKPTVTVFSDSFVQLKPTLTDRYDSNHHRPKPVSSNVHDKIRPLSGNNYGSSSHSEYDDKPIQIVSNNHDRPDPNHGYTYERPNNNAYNTDSRPGTTSNRYTTQRPEHVTYLIGYVPNRRPTDNVVTTALHDPVINDNFNTFLSYNDRPPTHKRPSYTTRRPTYYDEKPTYTEIRPTYADSRPSYDHKPAYSDHRPSYTNPRPTFSDSRPTYYDRTTSRPTTTYVQIASSKPSFDNSPSYVNNRPTYGNRNPSTGNIVNSPPSYDSRPTQSDNSRPTYSVSVPNLSDDIPVYSGLRPTYGQKPTYSDSKPTSYGPKPSYQNTQPVLQDYYGDSGHHNRPGVQNDNTKYSVVHSVTIVTNKKPEYYDELDHQLTYGNKKKGEQSMYVKTTPNDSTYVKLDSDNKQSPSNTYGHKTTDDTDVYGHKPTTDTDGFGHKNTADDNAHKQTYPPNKVPSHGIETDDLNINEQVYSDEKPTQFSDSYGLGHTNDDSKPLYSDSDNGNIDKEHYQSNPHTTKRPFKYVYNSNVLYRIETPPVVDTSEINKDFEPVISYYKSNSNADNVLAEESEEQSDMLSRNAQTAKRVSNNKKKPQVSFELLPSESEPDLWLMFEASPAKKPLPAMPHLADGEEGASVELPRPLKTQQKVTDKT